MTVLLSLIALSPECLQRISPSTQGRLFEEAKALIVHEKELDFLNQYLGLTFSFFSALAS